MTKILVECPELIASVRLGVLNPLRYWETQNKCTVRFRRTVKIQKKDIEWCDILISVRGFELPSEMIVKIAKAAGRFCVYFLDDDLADMPPEIPSADFVIKLNARKHIQEILRQCDVLWTVNALLAEKYRTWCDRVVVARVPAEVVTFSPHKFYEERINVLYAGSTDHEHTIQEQLSPAIRRISEEYPQKFQFIFVGVDPGLADMENVRCLPFLDSYGEYRAFVLNGQFCLGLAPLKDGFFYQCKYYNKFIEYASMGIVGIYANQPPYTLIVQDQVNGFLCEDTPEVWYKSILAAASDRLHLEQCANQAAEQLRCDFSVETVGELLCDGIPELINYQAPEVKVCRLQFLFIFLVYYLECFLKIWRCFTSRRDK